MSLHHYVVLFYIKDNLITHEELKNMLYKIPLEIVHDLYVHDYIMELNGNLRPIKEIDTPKFIREYNNVINTTINKTEIRILKLLYRKDGESSSEWIITQCTNFINTRHSLSHLYDLGYILYKGDNLKLTTFGESLAKHLVNRK